MASKANTRLAVGVVEQCGIRILGFLQHRCYLFRQCWANLLTDVISWSQANCKVQLPSIPRDNVRKPWPQWGAEDRTRPCSRPGMDVPALPKQVLAGLSKEDITGMPVTQPFFIDVQRWVDQKATHMQVERISQLPDTSVVMLPAGGAGHPSCTSCWWWCSEEMPPVWECHYFVKAFSGPSSARYPDVLMQNALAQAAGAPGLLAPLSSTRFIFNINTALSSPFLLSSSLQKRIIRL